MSEIEITLRPKGSETIIRAIESYDKAVGRSAAAAKSNAEKAEKALDAQILKQKELTRELKETKDALANAEKGSDEFKKLQKQIRDLTEAEQEAKAKTKSLQQGVSEAAKEAETAANSFKGLTLRLAEAKQIAQQAEFGSDAAKDAKLRVEALEDALESMKGEHKSTAKAVAVHKNSIKALERELQDATDELQRMDRASDTYQQQAKKVQKLNSELSRTKGGIRGISSEGSRLVGVTGKVGAQIKGVAAGFVGISEAIQAVTFELEKASRIQKGAAGKTRTVEESIADVAMNIGGENVGEARQLIEDNFKRLGTTQEGLANLIGIAVSAGAKDVKEAFDVSEKALKLTAGNADKAIEQTQTSLDIASLSGSTNFAGALGQVSQTQSVVRSVNPAEFFSNIGPALATSTAEKQNTDGISTERALEISSVFSQILKDRTGSNSATAQRQFLTRLDSFQPERKAKLEDGSEATVSPEIIEQFKGTRSVDERVQLFRENNGLMRQFLDTQKESIGKSAIAEFISGTDRALEFEAKAKAAITSIDDAEVDYEKLVKAIDENTGNLRAEGRFQGAVAEFQTSGETGLQGQATKIFEDTIAQLDLPGLDKVQELAGQAELKAASETGGNLGEVAAKMLDNIKGDNASMLDFWKRKLNDDERELVANAQVELRAIGARIDGERAVQSERARIAPGDEAQIDAGLKKLGIGEASADRQIADGIGSGMTVFESMLSYMQKQDGENKALVKTQIELLKRLVDKDTKQKQQPRANPPIAKDIP